jgi:hypothetical protein
MAADLAMVWKIARPTRAPLISLIFNGRGDRITV